MEAPQADALAELGIDPSQIPAAPVDAEPQAPATEETPAAESAEGETPEVPEQPEAAAAEPLSPHERVLAELEKEDPEAAAALFALLDAQPEVAKVEPVPGAEETLPDTERVQLEAVDLANATAMSEQALYSINQAHQTAWNEFQQAQQAKEAAIAEAAEAGVEISKHVLQMLDNQIYRAYQENQKIASDAEVARKNYEFTRAVSREVAAFPEFAKSPKIYAQLRYNGQIHPGQPAQTQRDIFRAELKRLNFIPAKKSPLTPEQRARTIKALSKFKPGGTTSQPQRTEREAKSAQSKHPERLVASLARW